MTLFLKVNSKCTFSLNPTKSLEARTAGHPTAADLLLKTFMVTDSTHTPGNMKTVVANPEIFYTFFVSVFFLKSERSHSISLEMILFRYLCNLYASFRLGTYFFGISVRYYIILQDIFECIYKRKVFEGLLCFSKS